MGTSAVLRALSSGTQLHATERYARGNERTEVDVQGPTHAHLLFSIIVHSTMMHPFKSSYLVFYFYFYTIALAFNLPIVHPSWPYTQLLPQNFTRPIKIALPHDPTTFDIPHGTITFRDYGDLIPFLHTYEAIIQASKDATAHLGPEAPSRIDKGRLTYQRGSVQLDLNSTEGFITWTMWGHALADIILFVNQYEAVALSFDVAEDGIGVVAEGSLKLARWTRTGIWKQRKGDCCDVQ